MEGRVVVKTYGGGEILGRGRDGWKVVVVYMN